jgi:hypothetical protein
MFYSSAEARNSSSGGEIAQFLSGSISCLCVHIYVYIHFRRERERTVVLVCADTDGVIQYPTNGVLCFMCVHMLKSLHASSLSMPPTAVA